MDGGSDDKDAQRLALKRALARVAAGDRDALRTVYGQTSAKLFGICLRILGDRAEAEDALQDVYVNVWRKAGSFDGDRSSPITWLASMARNRSIDRLRASRRVRETAPMDAASGVADARPSPLEQLDTDQTTTRLHGCIGELEDQTATAIRSAFFGGHTYAELSTHMDVPLGTMKSWIRRGLQRLKDCLER